VIDVVRVRASEEIQAAPCLTVHFEINWGFGDVPNLMAKSPKVASLRRHCWSDIDG
jgi:hypothetical protein